MHYPKRIARSLVRALVAGCFATIALSVASIGFADSEDDAESLLQAWADAYNAHDARQLVALYHPGAAFWGTTSPTLRTTPAAIAEYFARLPDRPNARVSIGEHVIRIAGPIAIVTGHYTFTDRVDGADVTRPSRFSFVMEQGEDSWRIVQHHSSRLPN